VLAPAVITMAVLLVSSLPLWAIGAAAASPWVPGRWRPLRLLWMLLVMLVVESAALVALAVLWLATGFGRGLAGERGQAALWWLVRRYLDVVVGAARRVLRLTFETDLHAARAETADRARPLVVLSRHAGPGDSVLLVHWLLRQGLRPRVVLRETLRWSPALDVALGRLPMAFVDSGGGGGNGGNGGNGGGGEGRERIARLAAGMGPGDALVIFPEGRNFTPVRRRASIARLEASGDHAAAERARGMRHVLVPRSGGTVTALAAAPEARVVFVAHFGLEDLSSPIDLWRGTPMDAAVIVEVWRVAAEDVPRERDACAAWLDGWWRRIDGWLLAHHGRRALPDAALDLARPVEDPDTPTGRGADLA